MGLHCAMLTNGFIKLLYLIMILLLESPMVTAGSIVTIVSMDTIVGIEHKRWPILFIQFLPQCLLCSRHDADTGYDGVSTGRGGVRSGRSPH